MQIYTFTLKNASEVGAGAQLIVADERGAVRAAKVESVGPSKTRTPGKYIRLDDGTELTFFMDETVIVSQ